MEQCRNYNRRGFALSADTRSFSLAVPQSLCAMWRMWLKAVLLSGLSLNFDVQALDFLIKGGQRNVEALRRFGLIPVTFLQHVDDHVTLAIFHDVEQRGVSTMLEHGQRRRTSGNLVRKQVGTDVVSRGKHNGPLDDIFQFTNIAGPGIRHQWPQSFGNYSPGRPLILARIPIEEKRSQ